MTKNLIVVWFLGAGLLLAPAVAEAHVLKADGSIGAILHIDPADDPVAGEPSSFLFEFKDRGNKFSIEACNCSLAIYESDKQIYKTPLQAGSGNTGVGIYTFGKRGVYRIQAIGQPATAGSFPPFTLKYDIRVDRVSGEARPNKGGRAIYWLFGAIVVIFAILYANKSRRKPDA